MVLDARAATTPESADRAVQAAWCWAASGLSEVPQEWHEGEFGDDVTRVRCVLAEEGERRLFRTVVHRTDSWDASLLWRTTVDILVDQSRVECGVAVDEEVPDQRVVPSPLRPPLVGLLQALTRIGARAGSQRVSLEPQAVVGTDGGQRFVDHVLLDRGRHLPVVLFTSIKEQDGVYLPQGADPSLVARELCALAHVHLMPRTEDTHKLTRRLSLLSAYDGAVRIYWPGFSLNDQPPRHPLHLRSRLNTSSVPAIIRRVVDAGARAYRPPRGTQTLLAARWRAQELERIAAMAGTGEGELGALRAQLRFAIDENVRLTEELESLHDRLEHARAHGMGRPRLSVLRPSEHLTSASTQ